MKRKIELMHEEFGKDPEHICKECSNFITYVEFTGKGAVYWHKCKIYGDTNSEATDWRVKYTACGMFNEEWGGKPIIELRKHNGGNSEPERDLDGQMTFEMRETE